MAPGTPTGVSAGPIAGATSIAVTWAALTSLGSGEIYGYVATAFTRLISTSSVETCFIQSASATSCTIEGLQPGTNYFVDVAATNSVGSSPASSPRVKATPTLLKVPGAPTAVTAAPERSILSTTIKVSWDMPPGDGGSPITGYRASVFVGGSLIGSCVAGGSERSCLIQGLREGTTYSDVQVAAINSVGTCGTGKMQGTLTTVIGSGFDEWGPPKPVSAVTLTLGAGQMTVSWKAPSSPPGITGYRATATPRPQKFLGGRSRGSCSAKASETSVVIKGLSKGFTYDVVVTYTAVHPSIAKTATMPPSAPVSVVAR